METDLLSRAYRGGRSPLRTVCATKPSVARPGEDAGMLVEIEFPATVSFQSEARTEVRHWPLQRRRVRAYLALTAFFEARILVWHLTLRVDHKRARTDARYWVDEVDLITLGERRRRRREPGTAVRARRGQSAPADWRCGPIRTGSRRRRRRAATARGVRFRRAPADRGRQVAQAQCRQAAALVHTDPAAIEREVPPLPRRLSPQAVTLQLFGSGSAQFERRIDREALCGLVSCIFDFDEIDDAEIDDTLRPSVLLNDHRGQPANVLLRAHRVALVHVARGDRAARTVENSTGISPYLVIPHATVLCNERLLTRVESQREPQHRSLTHARCRCAWRSSSTLRARWVSNVFFYDTEKRLFESTLTERGVSALRARAEELLLKVKTDLQLARDRQRAKFEAIVAGLLAGISVLSLNSLVTDTLRLAGVTLEAQDPWQGMLATLVIAIAISAIIGGVVYFGKRASPAPARYSRTGAAAPGSARAPFTSASLNP